MKQPATHASDASDASSGHAASLALSRRGFLHRLGAVGGGTLVLGALNAWELMAAPAGPRPRFSGRGDGTRVVVLGAGMSGLVVAHELGKLGYDVRVLEARDRVGGVNWSVRRGDTLEETGGERQRCDFDDGLYFNAGPWRIPAQHTAVLDYCRELGVALEPFINENDDGYVFYEGDTLGPLSGCRMRMREVKGDLRGHTAELLAKAVDQEALDLPLTPEDRERLVQYLVFEGYLDSGERAYRGSNARGGGAPHELAALLQSGIGNRFRSLGAATFGFDGPWFQPVGGMDRIPAAFARELGDRITLGAEVRRIRRDEDGVRVAWRDAATGREEEFASEFCVSCVPLSILRNIDANLSPELSETVGLVNYSGTAKIGLQMRRRFWEEDDGIYGGPTLTNLPLGQFSFPSNDLFSRKGVVLGFYASGAIPGPDGRPLVDLSNAERVEHVLAHAGRIHPQMRGEFETAFCAFWTRVPHSEGAYASGTGSLLDRLERPDGRLVLGCAAVSRSAAWLEGAVSAGWKAVESVHGMAQGEAFGTG
jgi:monoamine oxidase